MTGLVASLLGGDAAGFVLAPFPVLDARQAQRVVDLERAVAARRGEGEPWDWSELAEIGLLGIGAQAQTGPALGAVAHARLYRALGARDPGLALGLLVHEGLVMRALRRHGSAELCSAYLPRLAAGEWVGAFAMSEAEAGSDPQRLHSYAEPVSGGFRLRGTKAWVTNADRARLFLVIARTRPLREGRRPRLTAFAVERQDGVRVGERVRTTGVKSAVICDVAFDDVFVPASHVVGEFGKGIKVVLQVLSDLRPALACTLVGSAIGQINQLVQALRTRRSAGRTLGEFPLVREQLSELMIDCYGAESVAYLAAGYSDRRLWEPIAECSMSRVLASFAAERVAETALRLEGGRASLQKNYFTRAQSDCRALTLLDTPSDTLLTSAVRQSLPRGGERAAPGRVAALTRRAVVEARRRLAGPALPWAPPPLRDCADIYGRGAERLGRCAESLPMDRSVDVAEMQQELLRLGRATAQLVALGASIARTTRDLYQLGEVGAHRQVETTRGLGWKSQQLVSDELDALERRHDAVRLEVAARALADGGYPFDVF